MDLITSRFTPNRSPGPRLIWRSKLNFTSSAVISPKPLWNCTPFFSLKVHIVPSGERVQLSARSGSTSAVVTLPSLMAKRVRPRNMKRAIAWLCPMMLACGSRLSGSLAAMFRTFLRWASADGGSTRVASPTMERAAIAATSVSGNREEFWLNMGSLGESFPSSLSTAGRRGRFSARCAATRPKDAVTASQRLPALSSSCRPTPKVPGASFPIRAILQVLLASQSARIRQRLAGS